MVSSVGAYMAGEIEHINEVRRKALRVKTR